LPEITDAVEISSPRREREILEYALEIPTGPPLSDITDVVEITFPRREREILELICLGSAVKDIAYKLEIRVATVNEHIARMCRKAEVSRSELPIWALQNTRCLERDGKSLPGMHKAGCSCDSPYCAGMRRRLEGRDA
jgi:DNA-binding NarL/FixJ family response regulator